MNWGTARCGLYSPPVGHSSRELFQFQFAGPIDLSYHSPLNQGDVRHFTERLRSGYGVKESVPWTTRTNAGAHTANRTLPVTMCSISHCTSSRSAAPICYCLATWTYVRIRTFPFTDYTIKHRIGGTYSTSFSQYLIAHSLRHG